MIGQIALKCHLRTKLSIHDYLQVNKQEFRAIKLRFISSYIVRQKFLNIFLFALVDNSLRNKNKHNIQ